jgi:hypothetical protein
MQLFVILFLLFIIVADGRCRASCRRRRRVQRAQLQALNQVINVANILSSDKLSLFSKDYFDSNNYLYNLQMCPFMNEHIAVNGTWPQEPLSLETKNRFSLEYFTTIYNRENFPLTYRNSGVYFDIRDKNFDLEMKKYYRMHCEKRNGSFFGFVLLIILLAILATACCGNPTRKPNRR